MGTSLGHTTRRGLMFITVSTVYRARLVDEHWLNTGRYGKNFDSSILMMSS